MIMVRADGYQPFAGLQVDAGARGVPVEILPSASIAGTVVDDATGEPVAGFSLSLSPTKTPTFVAAKGRQRFEDGQGRFRYTDVRPGTHFLTAEAEGYAGGSSDSVVVTHGQQLENVVVRMVKGGELTGRVVSSSGEPVGGAKISLKGASDPSEADPAAIFMNIIQQQMRGSSRAATSGPDGIWTMPFVMPGDYKVSIAHADFAEGEAGPVSVSSGATTEVGDVILSRGALIEGLVLTADGEPDGKAQVMISATSQFGSKSYPTDPNGSFRASGLKAGTYRIVVTQREGQFRLLDVFLQQKDPSAEYTVSDGQVLELILQDKKP
jgi:hypothetical protein